MKLLLLAIPLLAAAQQGAIEGTAFNKLTKAPVPGVRVRMNAVSDRGKSYEAVTGIDGKYRIANLPPGDYSPTVNPPEGLAGAAGRDGARWLGSTTVTGFILPYANEREGEAASRRRSRLPLRYGRG